MYEPNPVNTEDIILSEDLLALTEKIAENIHEVWGRQRMDDGWKWGPERNDQKRTHPCLVPYDELPESEKEYDRSTVTQTLKMILYLGYKLQK